MKDIPLVQIKRPCFDLYETQIAIIECDKDCDLRREQKMTWAKCPSGKLHEWYPIWQRMSAEWAAAGPWREDIANLKDVDGIKMNVEAEQTECLCPAGPGICGYWDGGKCTHNAKRMIEQPAAGSCLWNLGDGDDDVWETSCGHAFYFIEGIPGEDGFVYCPYCGKPLTVNLPEKEES